MRFYAVGGYNEVGKNMSALEVNGETVIVDMGTHMDKLIAMSDDYETSDTGELTSNGVLPDDKLLNGKNVKAIIISHGHLDHVNAIPKLAEKYNCPIFGTPYTIEIIKRILQNHKKKKLIKNLYVMNCGDTAEISKNFQFEFVNTTHSIPHSTLIALYTPEGTVAFAYDYKLDNTPTLGEKPNYAKIKKLGKNGIKLLICECVRVRDEMRTPSEQIAKIMVHDALERAYEDSSAVIITTFASQIARLKGIIESNNGRRKILMLGRSMENYISAAESLGLIDTTGVELYGRGKTVRGALSGIKNPEEYLIVCTGNQGEPNSVLARISRKEYKFSLKKEDQVIFSSEIIPTPVNRANRYVVESTLKDQGARILSDVHVSGHAMREDHRDLLKMLSPQYVIPCHGETERLASYASLATEEGYVIGGTVRIMQNGRYVDLK